MLESFFNFARYMRSPSDRQRLPEQEADRQTLEPTQPEAHVAWLAGAPYASIPDDESERARFASLLIPFY